jgi:hypothetical protein
VRTWPAFAYGLQKSLTCRQAPHVMSCCHHHQLVQVLLPTHGQVSTSVDSTNAWKIVFRHVVDDQRTYEDHCLYVHLNRRQAWRASRYTCFAIVVGVS